MMRKWTLLLFLISAVAGNADPLGAAAGTDARGTETIEATAAGANSIRTYPGMLDEAQRHGFTALELKTVNQFGIAGPVSTAEIDL